MKTNFVIQEKVNRITYLIENAIEEELTAEQEIELNAWLAETDHNRLFFQQITNKEILKEKLKIYSSANSEAIWEKTLKKINAGKVVGIPKRKACKIPSLALTRWFATILQDK
jgi:transmembrane sensor